MGNADLVRVDSPAPRASLGAILAIMLLALAARESVAWISFGSADVGIFQRFSHDIRARGIQWLYLNEPGFNHPPLPGFWAAGAGAISDWLDAHIPTRWPWFSIVFKQPMIAADVVVCWLLYRWWSKRTSATTASLIALAFALSPLSILLSAHHGNTDPIYGMLCLLAAICLPRRCGFLLAGLALGAAIDVKFIPVLLVPVLGVMCRSFRQFARFALGLSIALLPLLLVPRAAFVRNVMQYSSTIDYWGIEHFLMEAARSPRFSAVAQTLAYSYHDYGRGIVVLAIVLLILTARRRERDATHGASLAACAAAIFLILAPGFGLQYLAFAAPLLFAVRPVVGIVYGFAGGLFALFNYWGNTLGGIPYDSTGIATPPRTPGPMFGLIAWIALVSFVWDVALQKRRGGSR